MPNRQAIKRILSDKTSRAVLGCAALFVLPATPVAVIETSAKSADISVLPGTLPKAAAPLLPPNQTRTSLALQVNILYGDQDEEIAPVTSEFYLLEASLIDILKTNDFKLVYPDRKKRRIKDQDYLEAAAKALTAQYESDDRAAEAAAFLIADLLGKHASRIIKTNRFGDGRSLTAVPGKYYLFGIAKISGQTIVWHLPVNLKTGFNTLSLDQNDALLIFD